MSQTSNSVALGFDVGGTKLATVAVHQDGEIAGRITTPTEAHEGGEAVLDRLRRLAHEIKEEISTDVVGIGIATHGVVTPDTGIVRFASSSLPGWTGTNLKENISAFFPEVPVWVANDGHTAALAEYLFGCGQGTNHFVMLVLGTGVGGGVIADGNLLQGTHGAAGRLGHLSIDPVGPQCSCGNRGCLELYVSGTAIAHAAIQNSELVGESEISLVSAQDIVTSAKDGNSPARSLLQHAGEQLGFGLLQITRVFDPEKIAIGGGMMSAGNLLLDSARQIVKSGTPPELAPPVIEWAQLGADASLLGAAALVWTSERPGGMTSDLSSKPNQALRQAADG